MPGYGTPLSLTLPTINGVAKESAAAPLINTALSAIIARLESKVGAADLDINADVSFKSGATYSGARDLQRAAFQSQASALAAASNPNTVYVLNGDLHYIDAAGNLVQITASGAVNVSTTGGITGSGYGTGGVEVNWDSGNSRFSFKSGAGADDFADVQVADVLLRDGTGNTIRFQAPAISSDYTITLPTGVPASTQILQMSSAGLVAAGNTISQPVTLSALLTANAGVTLATGQHVTVAGSGLYKRGALVRHVPVVSGQASGGTFALGVAQIGTWSTDAEERLFVPLVVQEGERITAVSARVSAAAAGMELSLMKISSGTVTEVDSVASSGAGVETLTISGLTETVTSTAVSYVARVTTTASGTETVTNISVTTTVP